jgi:cytochrome c-type biogenesis protein CcmH/NrfG
VLSDLKRYQDALDAYDQAIHLNPTNLLYQRNRAKVLGR